MEIEERDEEFLHGLAGPQHWTEEDARRALSLWEASGESRARFAERYGLRPTRFAWWAKRLDEWGAEERTERSHSGATLGHEAFVELVPSATATVAARVRIGIVEIELAKLDAAAARFVVELTRMMEYDPCS